LKIKEQYEYGLFTREAFFFSRTCELYGNYTRQDAFEAMQKVLDAPEEPGNGWRVLLLILNILPLIPLIVVCHYVLKLQSPNKLQRPGPALKFIVFMFPVYLLLALAGLGPLLSLQSAQTDMEEYQERLQHIEKMQEEGCFGDAVFGNGTERFTEAHLEDADSLVDGMGGIITLDSIYIAVTVAGLLFFFCYGRVWYMMVNYSKLQNVCIRPSGYEEYLKND